ncbi:MAG: Trp family transcriptional regulator [Patescibacteria group bacterium]
MGKFNYFPYQPASKMSKLSIKEQEDFVFDLINAFAHANTPTHSARLLHDLLTENEISNLAKRLRIAKLLLKGKTQEEVVDLTHSSFATVTKVNMWFDNAGDGLKHVISRLPKRRTVHQARWTPGIGYGLDQILLHYASLGLKKREINKLQKFLQNMRIKNADNEDLREETGLQYRDKRLKKHK